MTVRVETTADGGEEVQKQLLHPLYPRNRGPRPCSGGVERRSIELGSSSVSRLLRRFQRSQAIDARVLWHAEIRLDIHKHKEAQLAIRLRV